MAQITPEQTTKAIHPVLGIMGGLGPAASCYLYQMITDHTPALKDNGSNRIKAIPHNSKCRYGERGAATARPKAQIILDVLSSILATQMPCRSRRSGA